MKILVVSWFFPPYNAIGAIRVGKMAKFLRQQGHDVRVISAGNQSLEGSLAVEVPDANILRTRWVNLNAPAEMALGGSEQVKQHGYHAKGRLGPLLKKLKPLYKTLVHMPDAQIGWVPFAIAQGSKWLKGWTPDLIYASMLPISSLIAAGALAKHLNVPWVAELRDLGGLDIKDPGYYNTSRWRLAIDVGIIDRLLATTSGLVTVSDPMSEFLRQRYHKPTRTILNGFDPADLPTDAEVPYDNGNLNIVYTGMLYGGMRDPRPLFKAIQGMDAPRVYVHFYGRDLEAASRFAKELGISDQVIIHGLVPYPDALRAQATADIQLLLMVNHTYDNGSFTGKVFEYLGNRRPVLALGRDSNVACRLIADRNAGFVSLEPEEIRAQLVRWLDEKASNQIVAGIDPDVCQGLTREVQAQHLGDFFTELVEH